MNQFLAKFGGVLGLSALSLLIGLWLNSVGWALVLVTGGLLGFKIWREYQFKEWVKHPTQATDSLTETWRATGKHIARRIDHFRNRANTLLGALQRVCSTFDYVPDGWVIVHQRNRIEMFNHAAKKLLGIKSSDVGNDLSTLVRHPSLNRLLTDRDDEPTEITSPVDDSKRLEVRMVDLDENRTLVLARDVTELNRLLSMRQDFIANVSHKLRTPLTVMRGYVESMVSDDLDEQTVRELATRLVSPVDLHADHG